MLLLDLITSSAFEIVLQTCCLKSIILILHNCEPSNVGNGPEAEQLASCCVKRFFRPPPPFFFIRLSTQTVSAEAGCTFGRSD